MSPFCRAEKLTIAHLESELSFSLPDNSIVALLGPNGSGKTTLLRTLIGEEIPAGGRVWLNEVDASSLSPTDLSKVAAYVPQEHSFPDGLGVTDLLRLAFLPEAGLFKALPKADDVRIKDILQKFGLEKFANKGLHQISTGERQRAFLARAILQQPKILLLDEPTNHLDPGGVQAFWNLLVAEQAKHQFNVILSTHELTLVREHCDWVLALKEGQVAFAESTNAFFELKKELDLYGLNRNS